MAQARKLGLSQIAVFQDLPVNAGDRSKDGDVEGLHEARPESRVFFPCVDDRGCAVRPGVRKPGPHRIGPIEASGMHQAVIGGYPVPSLIHGPPPPGAGVSMQHALRVCRRARGVDQERRIACGCLSVLGHRAGLDGNRKGLFREDREIGREGAMGQAVIEQDGGCFAVFQHEGQFPRGEVRRCGDRNEAAGDGAEKCKRIGGAIAQADEDPAAGLQFALGSERIGGAKNRLLQSAVSPGFYVASGWIVDHQQRGFVPGRARSTQAISRHVEGLRRKIPSISKLTVAHCLP